MTFTNIVSGDPGSASIAMQNWRHAGRLGENMLPRNVNGADINNTYDLGSSAFNWKDLYLAGKLKLGSQSLAAAGSADGSTLVRLDASGGDFTLDLPSAVGLDGVALILKNTQSTGVVTVDPNGAQTIDNYSTRLLGPRGKLIIVSNNSNWDMIDYDSGWISYTPTFTGLGTVTNINYYYNIKGTTLSINGYAETGTHTAVEIQISLPSGAVSSSNYSATATNSVVGIILDDFGGNRLEYPIVSPNENFMTIGEFAGLSTKLFSNIGTGIQPTSNWDFSLKAEIDIS
jgi:hypothetical protein